MGIRDGTCAAPGDATALRRDPAQRPVVGAAARGAAPPVRVRRLRHVGRVPGQALHVRPLPVAVLLARVVRRLAARLVRTEAGVVAGVARVLARAPDPAVPGFLPADLLLL